MIFKKTFKKICSLVTAGLIGVTLTFPTLPMPSANAIGIGDAIGLGMQAATLIQQRNMIKKQLLAYNYTSEGQQNLYSTFTKKYGVVSDPTLNALLSKVMTNVTAGVAKIDPSIKEKPYKYFISDDATLNAACGMGHVMMVNRGTFEKVSNEDELAAIIGHEIGHGQKDHTVNSNMKSIDKQIIAAMGVSAIGVSGGIVVGSIANLASRVALVNMNAHAVKKNEWEADNLAFDYLLQTNYNPGACAAIQQRFVELFAAQEKSRGKNILNPSDHPNSGARRDNYVKKLYEYSGNHVTAKNGVVTVNKKELLKTVATSDMSAAERSYFILGNLAIAYHRGYDESNARVEGGTVYLGAQPIIAPVEGEGTAQDIANRLNQIK